MNTRYTPLFEKGPAWFFPDPTAYLCKQHNELFHFGEECPSCMQEEDAAEEHERAKTPK